MPTLPYRPHPLRLARGAALALLLLGVLAWGAAQWGLHQLAGQLHDALGPRTQLGAIEVDALGLSLRDLRVPASPGWPAEEELHAGHVYLRPSWRSLFVGPWRLARIEVSDARIVLLRGRDGRLQWLPHLQAIAGRVGSQPGTPGTGKTPPWVIDLIRLQGVQVDLFDDSFKPLLKRPQHLQLSQVQARIHAVRLPAADSAVPFTLTAAVPGQHPGTAAGSLQLDGQVTPLSRDAQIHLVMRGVDLRLLQPWLLKAVDAGVQAGTLDLDLHATVQAQQVNAPGRMTLTGLRLSSGAGLWDKLGGASRDAVLATLARDGKIVLDFQLQGRLDDPAFSLNDSLAKRFATSLAEAVGVSVGGVVQGLGRAIKGLFGR